MGVIGLGRVGLPLAIRLSQQGFVVEGVDFDPARENKVQLKPRYLQQVSPGFAPIHRDCGFCVRCDVTQISEVESVILCPPLISEETPEPDLRLVREVAFAVASRLHAGQLIVIESPPDPGMTEEVIVPILESANDEHLKVSRNTGAPNDVFIGVSPASERRNANPADPQDEPSKVVAGVDTLSMELTAELYSTIFTTVVPLACPSRREVLRLLQWMSATPGSKGKLMQRLEQLCRIPSPDWSGHIGSRSPDMEDDAREMDIPIDPFYLALKQSQLGYPVRSA